MYSLTSLVLASFAGLSYGRPSLRSGDAESAFYPLSSVKLSSQSAHLEVPTPLRYIVLGSSLGSLARPRLAMSPLRWVIYGVERLAGSQSACMLLQSMVVLLWGRSSVQRLWQILISTGAGLVISWPSGSLSLSPWLSSSCQKSIR